MVIGFVHEDGHVLRYQTLKINVIILYYFEYSISRAASKSPPVASRACRQAASSLMPII